MVEVAPGRELGEFADQQCRVLRGEDQGFGAGIVGLVDGDRSTVAFRQFRGHSEADDPQPHTVDRIVRVDFGAGLDPLRKSTVISRWWIVIGTLRASMLIGISEPIGGNPVADEAWAGGAPPMARAVMSRAGGSRRRGSPHGRVTSSGG